MHSHRLLLTLLLTGVLTSAQLQAEEPVAQTPVNKPELTWCLDHFSRFHHYEDVATPFGPSVELMQELARRSGFTLRFTPRTPVSRCFRLLAEGKADLMSNLKFSPDRAEIMFLLPYETTVAESVFLRRNDDRPLAHFNQLKNLTVASIRGYLFSQATMQFLKQNSSHVAEVDSIESGLEMLYRGRVDALISPTVSTSEAIFATSSYQDRFRIAALEMGGDNVEHINIGLSRASPHKDLLPVIKSQLQAMQQDGTVKRLYTDVVINPKLQQLKRVNP
uniref:Probable ABC transporter, periplasmic substrate-binding protein n=1 Tax=Rheinheimera sp. BAL341 TaxID=1708203 RepID=A0A486XL27_9GAMM